MTYRLLPSSSDVIVEAEGRELGDALVELAKAFTDVTTHGSRARVRLQRRLVVEREGDLPVLAVAFFNHLVFLFSTEQFLPSGGSLRVSATGGRNRVEGTLDGEAFDPARHEVGTEVKAATFHDAVFAKEGVGGRVRLLLDL